MLSLPILRALSEQTPYGGQRLLTSLPAVIALSAASYLEDLNNWEGAGFELTTAEIDEIQEAVAELTYELMEEESPIVSDYVKIAEVSASSDVAYLDSGILNFSGYNLLKIYISGMVTNRASVQYDHVVMRWDGNDTMTDYRSLNWYGYYNSGGKVENISDRDGMFLNRASLGNLNPNGFAGSADITVYRPNAADYLSAKWETMSPGGATGEQNLTSGMGSLKTITPRQSFRIEPYNGSLFLIDSSDSDYPDYLQMSIYGLE